MAIEKTWHVPTVSDIPVFFSVCNGSSNEAECPEVGFDVRPRSAVRHAISVRTRQRQLDAILQVSSFGYYLMQPGVRGPNTVLDGGFAIGYFPVRLRRHVVNLRLLLLSVFPQSGLNGVRPGVITMIPPTSRSSTSPHGDGKVAVGNCLFQCRATLMCFVRPLKSHSPSNFREALVRKAIGDRFLTSRVDEIGWVSWGPSVVYVLSRRRDLAPSVPRPFHERDPCVGAHGVMWCSLWVLPASDSRVSRMVSHTDGFPVVRYLCDAWYVMSKSQWMVARELALKTHLG